MGLVEDDTILHPHIDQDYLLYISGLNEGHEAYTRFFDALLIKRNQHGSFFRDLKAFREQPQVIKLLQNATTVKKLYRQTTLTFLDSRFAHPWCRKTPMKKAFWRAEWGTIQGKERDAEIAREEDRLHKLLVPLWIIMRSKMFPGDEVVRKWCIEEKQRRKQKEQNRLTMAVLKIHEEESEKSISRVRSAQIDKASHSDTDEDDQDEQQAAAHAATSVFRLAAAGIILSQTPKRKLRWLVKKP